MNKALVASVTVHAIGLIAVIAMPQAKTPRWHQPDAITVGLAAPASRPKATPPPKVEPLPAEAAPEAADKTPPEVQEVKPAPTKKPPPMRPAPPRTIRRDAPRRDPGPSLEERIRRRLENVDSSEEPAPAPKTPAPAGASGSTAEVQAVDFPYAWYLNVLRTRITDAWDPPGETLLTGRGNKVTVAFRLYRDGHVTDVRVDVSGTPGLDASARRAVERAQPFPPLPDTYPGDFLDVAVRFTAKGSQ